MSKNKNLIKVEVWRHLQYLTTRIMCSYYYNIYDFSDTYYSEVRNAISFCEECKVLPNKVIYVVQCPYNLYNLFILLHKMKFVVRSYCIV